MNEFEEEVGRAVARALSTLPQGGQAAAADDGGRYSQAGMEGINGRAVFGDAGGAGAGDQGESPRPWEMIWKSDGTVDFVNCMYRRGPTFKKLADVTGVTITGGTGDEDGTAWIGAKINTQTGLCEAILSGGQADATFAEPPEDPKYDRLPLYILRRVGSGETATWEIELDMRSLGLMLYV